MLKPYKIMIPNIICDTATFETFDEAEDNANRILKTTAVRFVSVFYNDKLLTILIKKDYSIFNFKAFSYLELNGYIQDYFIIKIDESTTNYYIKLKTKKK